MPDFLQYKKYTIMIGNPGTGKSTFLNGLFGKIIYQSGTSWGSGLTKILQLNSLPNDSNDIYGDTPGLSDLSMRKKAALEIEQALKQGGHYRLIFVITLEAGRVRPDDATTLKLVLEAVKIDIPFAIIINKLSEDECNVLMSDEEAKKSVLVSLTSTINKSTPYFYALKQDSRLHGKNNVVPELDIIEDLVAFLRTVPFRDLTKDNVLPINSTTYDEQVDRITKDIAKLKSDQAAMETMYQQKISDMETKITKLEEELKNKPKEIIRSPYVIPQNPQNPCVKHRGGGGCILQ